MKKYFIFAILAVGTIATVDAVPPYVQVQVDNLDQQIAQLKSQRDDMQARMKSMQQDTNVNRSFAQQETQTQIDNINKHIEQLERQKTALLK